MSKNTFGKFSGCDIKKRQTGKKQAMIIDDEEDDDEGDDSDLEEPEEYNDGFDANFYGDAADQTWLQSLSDFNREQELSITMNRPSSIRNQVLFIKLIPRVIP